METLLTVPQGQFELQRLPQRKDNVLRAWDAADEYLLHHVAENNLLEEGKQLLILNDGFGALTVALNTYHPVAISDSWLSQQSTRFNMDANGLTLKPDCLNNALNWPEQSVDMVLIKIPKTLALLEDQLIRLQTLLKPETVVIAAGMVKAMSANVWKLIARYLGETKPSLAKKKARLIFTTLSLPQKEVSNPYPSTYQLENTDYQISNHANVFSRDSLDIGTRFLLAHLPKNTAVKAIVDLGCGNGVVGLLLARDQSEAHLSFVDESYMAVASAKNNFQSVWPDRVADFRVTDGLLDFESNSVDLIVCNPPFHQQNVMGNQIALTMFRQSHRVLKKQGKLIVIGNRHLAYHIDLKRLFGRCDTVAENKKFVIWSVTK